MRENYRNSIARVKIFPQFITMNVIDGQAGLVIYSSLIFYSLTIDNILNIVILIILATVTINMAFGDNGLIKYAEEARDKTANSTIAEAEGMNKLVDEYANVLAEDNELDNRYDIFVYLYDDGTLSFGTQNEPIEGKTVKKEYGNIKGQEYSSWIDEDNNQISSTPWYNESKLIKRVNIVDTIVPVTMANWFTCCENLTEIENIERIDTKEVKNMTRLFDGCSSLTNLNLSSFDTSNVVDMGAMFGGCTNLINLNLSNFGTNKVESMGWLFDGCSSLINLNLSSFNTNNVTNMNAMFANCKNLTEIIGLEKFNTSSAKIMTSMFYNCSNLTSLNLSSFDTSNVENMGWMFYNCSNLTSLRLSSFDTSNVENTEWMFQNCSNLTSLDLSSFDTSNMKLMDAMFAYCTNLTIIYVGNNWNLSNVENTSNMFVGCGTNTTTHK